MTMANELVSTEDLQFNVNFETSKITIDNEEKLMKIANLYAARYADIVVSLDTEKDVKKIRAEMKKVVKAMDDKRKKIKREYNQPLAEFEQKIKAINTVINNVIDPIDKGLKELDQLEREKRRDEVQAIIDETTLSYGIPAELITIQDSWLNKSKSTLQKTKEIAFEVETVFNEKEKMNNDIESIKRYAKAVNVEPGGWIKQIENGVLVADVMSQIDSSIKRQQAELELEQENERKREAAKNAIEELNTKTVNDVKVNTQTGEIIPEKPIIERVAFTIEGTPDELDMIARYIMTNHIKIVDSSSRKTVGSDN